MRLETPELSGPPGGSSFARVRWIPTPEEKIVYSRCVHNVQTRSGGVCLRASFSCFKRKTFSTLKKCGRKRAEKALSPRDHRRSTMRTVMIAWGGALKGFTSRSTKLGLKRVAFRHSQRTGCNELHRQRRSKRVSKKNTARVTCIRVVRSNGIPV